MLCSKLSKSLTQKNKYLLFHTDSESRLTEALPAGPGSRSLETAVQVPARSIGISSLLEIQDILMN